MLNHQNLAYFQNTPTAMNAAASAHQDPASQVAAAAGAPQQPVADQPDAQPAQRRFPNLVVDEPQENRDWLDISYMMLRIAIVITVIYVYSSPIRFMAVFSIGAALVLYRRGILRNPIEHNVNGNQQNQNNNNNNNNNNNLNNNNNDAAAPVAAAADGADAEVNTNGENPEQNRTSMLVMIRTFILSFIFSLIPETPAL